MRAAFVLVALPLLLTTGCGEDTGAPEAERSAEPTRLAVTKPDGTEVVLDEITATCGPSDNDPETDVVRILGGSPDDARVVGEVVPGDVEGGRTFELPVDTGDQEEGAANVLLYVGAVPDLETSSREEESSGTLTVVRASCDPVTVELTVKGTLGSEFSDGETADVEGRIVFPAPAG